MNTHTTPLRLIAALSAILASPIASAVGPLEPPPVAGQVPQQLNYQGRVSVQGVNFNGAGQFKFALVDGGVNYNQTATAFASTDGSSFTNISLLYFGSGYTTPPTVTISAPDAPGGVQATAVAVVANVGTNIARIDITNAGSGYTNSIALSVTVAPPPPNILVTTYWSNDGTGTSGAEPTAAVTLPVSSGLYSVALGDSTLAHMTAVPASVFTDATPLPPILGYIPGPRDVRLRVWFDDGTHGSQLLTPDQKINTVGFAHLASTVQDGAITSAKIASGAVTLGNIADGAVGPTKFANGSVTAAKIADGAISAAKVADAAITPAKLLSAAPPVAGQIARFDGTQFAWSADGVTLPFSGSTLTGEPSFSVTNQGTGPAISALGGNGNAILAFTSTDGKAAFSGRTDTLGTGQGVYGYAGFNGVGVLGVSERNDGVSGRTNAIGKAGVYGYAEGADSAGLNGTSLRHHGVYASTGSTDRAALWAYAPNGAEGLHAHGESNDGAVGYTNGAGKAGVYGWTNRADGRGGFFGNYNGGEALRTGGRAAIGGNLLVEGGLTVQGTVDFQMGINVPAVFGDHTLAYAPNMLVCGAYNDTTQFPLSGVKPLFQVGNGNNALQSNSFSVLENGDAYVKNRLRAADVETAAVYAGNVYANTDVNAGRLLGGSISISTFGTYKPGGGVWLPSLSDGRFKDIESEYKSGLAEVSKIRPVRYRYKANNPDRIASDAVYLGVVAQDLQTAMPAAVITRPDGYLTVDLDQIQWAVLNAVKELKTENDKLRTRLETETTALRERLEKLEKLLPPNPRNR